VQCTPALFLWPLVYLPSGSWPVVFPSLAFTDGFYSRGQLRVCSRRLLAEHLVASKAIVGLRKRDQLVLGQGRVLVKLQCQAAHNGGVHPTKEDQFQVLNV